MMEVSYYTEKGTKKKAKLKVADGLLDVPFNADLVYQVVRSYQLRQRRPLAHTKDRGEVAGSGRKPWPQKGTGRARHGSIRSPLWVGGGVVFGPGQGRSFYKKIPKKMKRQALSQVLSLKRAQGELLVVDDFTLPAPKTKLFAEKFVGFLRQAVDQLPDDPSRISAALITPQAEQLLLRASRNLPNFKVMPLDHLNAYQALKYKYLVITKDALKKLARFYEDKD